MADKYLKSYKSKFQVYTIINTVDFRVPQTRRRLFLGAGWEIKRRYRQVSLLESLPYLKDEGIRYVKGYAGTRSVHVDGHHLGNVKISGMQSMRDINRPTYTLCASAPMGLYDADLNRVRTMTIREALVIQGFPIGYYIPEYMARQIAFKLVGNAVSPAVAQMIMSS